MLPGLASMILGIEAAAGIQLVGYATLSGSGTLALASLSGGIGSAPAQGDLVLLAVMSDATFNQSLAISTPAGYNELADIYADGTAYDTNLGVYGKIQTATPDTSITIPSGVDASIAAVFRGTNTSNPTDATTTTATGSGASANPPSITTVTANAAVVIVGANGSASTLSAPAGYTAIASLNPGFAAHLTMAYRILAVAGAENPAAFSISGSSEPEESWAAATIALKPA